MAQKKQLGQILLEAGAIDEFQLKSALGYQKQWGGRLGKVLVENRFITEDALVQAIESQTGIPVVDVNREDIPEQIVKMVPVELAENLSLIPLRMEGEVGKPGETLVLAMSDPTNLNAQDEVQFRVGKKIKALLATEGSISKAIREYYYGEKPSNSSKNVFKMNPDEIQFGGSELAMDEMVVVKGKLESNPEQAQPAKPAASAPPGQAPNAAVEFEDPFAELDSLAKEPDPPKPANPFDSPPPAAIAPAPAPASAPATDEDDLQEVEIVEELPAWEDEQTDESNIGAQAAPPLAVTPLEDLETKQPAPVPKVDEPEVPRQPAVAEPVAAKDDPAPEVSIDTGEFSAFGASGDLLGSVDEEADSPPASVAKPSAPPAALKEKEKDQEEDKEKGKEEDKEEDKEEEEDITGGIADREETIRLRTIPRPQPEKKIAEAPATKPGEPPAPVPPEGGDEEVDSEEDSDQEDTITLRKIPTPDRPEPEADQKADMDATEPPVEKPKPAKSVKPGSMEALLSRVGIGNKVADSAPSAFEPEAQASSDTPVEEKPTLPKRREAKSQEFEDLLGEELAEEVQTLLESIESGEIDEEPPQTAKASHLIATVIRLLLKKEVFSEIELLEELKRR